MTRFLNTPDVKFLDEGGIYTNAAQMFLSSYQAARQQKLAEEQAAAQRRHMENQDALARDRFHTIDVPEANFAAQTRMDADKKRLGELELADEENRKNGKNSSLAADFARQRGLPYQDKPPVAPTERPKAPEQKPLTPNEQIDAEAGKVLDQSQAPVVEAARPAPLRRDETQADAQPSPQRPAQPAPAAPGERPVSPVESVQQAATKDGKFILIPTSTGKGLIPFPVRADNPNLNPEKMRAAESANIVDEFVPDKGISEARRGGARIAQQEAASAPPVEDLMMAATRAGAQGMTEGELKARENAKAQQDYQQQVQRFEQGNPSPGRQALAIGEAEAKAQAQRLDQAAVALDKQDPVAGEKMRIVAELVRSGTIAPPTDRQAFLQLMNQDLSVLRTLLTQQGANARAAAGLDWKTGNREDAQQFKKDVELPAALERARVGASAHMGMEASRDRGQAGQDRDRIVNDFQRIAKANNVPTNITRFYEVKNSLGAISSGNNLAASEAVRLIAKSANSGALSERDVYDMEPNAGVASRMWGYIQRAATGDRLTDAQEKELTTFMQTRLRNTEAGIKRTEKLIVQAYGKDPLWQQFPNVVEGEHAKMFGATPWFQPIELGSGAAVGPAAKTKGGSASVSVSGPLGAVGNPVDLLDPETQALLKAAKGGK